MSGDPLLNEFPEGDNQPPSKKKAKTRRGYDPVTADVFSNPAAGRLEGVWEKITRAGLAETVQRTGTNILLVAVILFVAWGLRTFYLQAQSTSYMPRSAAMAAALPSPTPTALPPELPPFDVLQISYSGISRLAEPHTDIPSLPRSEVITYTVATGDTLFDIAEKFGLQPQTLLWGNYYVLADDPHNLQPDQVLNILPVDGTYHEWSEGEGLNSVAKYYGVTPQEIIEYPGNHLSIDTIGDLTNPNIEPGTWLIVPGGSRPFISWSAPEIPRDNPGVASNIGPGVCGSTVEGAIGIGAFIWPAQNRFLSGFDYNPGANHPGVDVDGDLGHSIYAADNGVVVFAGWNNWGYGNMVVINHGNGWQTLYAHLNTYDVACGQSVYQGTQIGTMGSTGNSSGPHLHFEMMYQGVKVNPWDYLQ